MDGPLRHCLELFAAVGAAFSITYRACTVLNPALEFPVLTESPLLRTSVGEINVVVIWLLLGVLYLSGVWRMWRVVAELGAERPFAWMLARSFFTVLCSIFLLYDTWLVVFIYTTWVKDFLVVFQAVYVFPVLSFLAHYAYQCCFIGMAYRNVFLGRQQNANLSRVASLNAAVNLVMLLHLVCTFVVTYKTSPQELLEVSWLMLLELAFRLVGLVTFLRIYYQQSKSLVEETEYDDGNTFLVFAVPPPLSLVHHDYEEYQVIPQPASNQSNKAISFVISNNLSLERGSHPQCSLCVL